ncbi:MAG: phosphoribosyltransferase family protein [Bacteroidota bacterium]|nr:phosphoribosyltransferase family protein [Bacteroidota bacterium]
MWVNLTSDYLKGFLELFFPRYCLSCGKKLLLEEQYLCLDCLLHLPRTNFHAYKENSVMKLFWGRVPVEMATSYFFFKKGNRSQVILHELKYKGHKELGLFLGRRLGFELKESELFREVELVIPVPLHPKKLEMRKYNQSEWIAKGISEAMELPLITDAVVRSIFTKTQTKRTRFSRWENVEGVFHVEEPELVMGKHILLVDDVVTTGATLEACASALLTVPGVKVSIATLAVASL